MTSKNMSDEKERNTYNIVRQKYADILPLSRPEPSCKHPRMSLLNRAKIFSPFAALRGYEEEIHQEGLEHLQVPRTELSDEDKEKLSHILLQIRKGMTVTVCFFEAGTATADLGYYRTITGSVGRIDPVFQELEIYTENKDRRIPAGASAAFGKELPVIIPFQDILTCSSNARLISHRYQSIKFFNFLSREIS